MRAKPGIAAALLLTFVAACATRGTPPRPSEPPAPIATPSTAVSAPSTPSATSGGAGAPGHTDVVPPGSANATSFPAGLHWFRNSAEYRALASQVYRAATHELGRVAAAHASSDWAVILDADETVLDNSDYQKEIAARGETYSDATWDAWVKRRAAREIPGVRAFLRRVRELGGRIAIVTNRYQRLCPDTEANFSALSLPFDAILCRPEGGPGDKNPRFERVRTGDATGFGPLDVVMWLGDNIQDFPALSQTDRDKPGVHPDFGTRFFALPNPMYGSWERTPKQ